MSIPVHIICKIFYSIVRIRYGQNSHSYVCLVKWSMTIPEPFNFWFFIIRTLSTWTVRFLYLHYVATGIFNIFTLVYSTDWRTVKYLVEYIVVQVRSGGLKQTVCLWLPASSDPLPCVPPRQVKNTRPLQTILINLSFSKLLISSYWHFVLNSAHAFMCCWVEIRSS